MTLNSTLDSSKEEDTRVSSEVNKEVEEEEEIPNNDDLDGDGEELGRVLEEPRRHLELRQAWFRVIRFRISGNRTSSFGFLVSGGAQSLVGLRGRG